MLLLVLFYLSIVSALKFTIYQDSTRPRNPLARIKYATNPLKVTQLNTARTISLQQDSSQNISSNGIETNLHMNDDWYSVMSIGDQFAKFLLDTGSSTTWLASVKCSSQACGPKKDAQPLPDFASQNGVATYSSLYDPSKSNTSVIIDTKVKQIQYGSGTVNFILAKDTLKIYEDSDGSNNVITVPGIVFGMATKLSKEPFIYFDFDGIFGLGFPELAVSGTQPSLFYMRQQGVIPRAMFSYHLTPVVHLNISPQEKTQMRGEIDFGSFDSSKFVGQIRFIPIVNPSYWTIDLRQILVDTNVLYDMSSRGGNQIAYSFFDTGTTDVVFPAKVAQNLAQQLNMQLQQGLVLVQCASVQSLPSITFAFDSVDDSGNVSKGNNKFTLYSNQYVYTDLQQDGLCATIFSYDASTNMAIIGESFIEHFYSVWDVEGKRIGFADLKA